MTLVLHLFLQKVFPEAAALANGSKQDDAFDLPSDDSDDNDFDPNMSEEHVASKEEGSSEEEEDEDGGSDSDNSNFLTSSDSDGSGPLTTDKKKVDDLGLPSEDSEDDDYDPAGPGSDNDSDKDIQKNKSTSDESDFTSDSDDFCEEIAKSGGHDEVSSPPLPDVKVDYIERSTAQANTENSNDDPMETEMDQSVVLPVSGRRQTERLDYEKLYDVCPQPVCVPDFITFLALNNTCSVLFFIQSNANFLAGTRQIRKFNYIN